MVKTLSDKMLGYGKIEKGMTTGEYNFFGKEMHYAAEGFVFTKEDVKAAVNELLNPEEDLPLTVKNLNIRVKRIFGEKLV